MSMLMGVGLSEAAETELSLNPGNGGAPVSLSPETATFSIGANLSYCRVEVTPMGQSGRYRFDLSREDSMPLKEGVVSELVARPEWSPKMLLRVSAPNSTAVEIAEFTVHKLVTTNYGGVLGLWLSWTGADGLSGTLKYQAEAVGGFNQKPGLTYFPVSDFSGKLSVEQSTELMFRAGDDSAAENLTFQWSKIRGVGEVTFSAPNSPRTQMTFSRPGSYVLEYTAFDGVQTATKRVALRYANSVGISNTAEVTHSYYTNGGRFAGTVARVGDQYADFYADAIAGGGILVRTGYGDDKGIKFIPKAGESLVVGAENLTENGAAIIEVDLIKGTNVFQKGAFVIEELTRREDGSVEAAWITWRTQKEEFAFKKGVLNQMRIGSLRSEGALATQVITKSDSMVRGGSSRLWLNWLSSKETSDQPTYQWAQVSGPGEAHFFAPDQAETEVELSIPGDYVLSGTVTVDGMTKATRVSLHQSAPETSFSRRFIADSQSVNAAAEFYTPRSSTQSASFSGTSIVLRKDWEALVTLTPPPGQTFEVGTYSAGAGFEKLEIKQLQRDQAGALLSLWAVYTTRTTVPAGVVVVDFRINADTDPVQMNQAPVVKLRDLSMGWSAGVGVSLMAPVEDDGLPRDKGLSFRWECLSDPSVAIENANARRAWVNFPAPGKYRMKLTVSDGELATADEMDVLIAEVNAGLYEGFTIFEDHAVGLSRLKVNALGLFTGQLRVGRLSLPLRGKFLGNYWSSHTEFTFGSYLDIHLSLEGPGRDRIIGTVDYDGEIITMDMHLSAKHFLDAIHEPLRSPGKYTFVIPGPKKPGQPYGNGFGQLQVSSNGTTRMSGLLGDGEPFSAGNNLTVGEQLHLFALCYRGSGVLSGTLELLEDSPGQLLWDRPEMRRGRFPSGFDLEVEFYKSPYAAPKKNSGIFNQPVLARTGKFELIAQGWDLPAQTFTLQSNHIAAFAGAMPKWGLRLWPATGLFKGTFLNPADRKLYQFRGAVFQAAQTGFGCFQTPTLSGAAEFQLEALSAPVPE